MFVACSTLCFARHSLENALKLIAELEFTKFEVAVHEQGPHLRPSEVAADVARAANRLPLDQLASASFLDHAIDHPHAPGVEIRVHLRERRFAAANRQQRVANRIQR